jgi:hypothetical protein
MGEFVSMVVRVLFRSSVLVSVFGFLTAQGCAGPEAEAEAVAGGAGVAASSSGGTSSQATGGTGGRGGAASDGSAGRGGSSSSGGSSTSTGGSTGGGEAGGGGEGGVESPGEGGTGNAPQGGTGAVPSGDGYPAIPPPVCDARTDYPCDEDRRVECAAPDEVISFDAARDASCPVCAPPPAGARSCEKSQREYREFLAAVISASCANYCEEDADCVAWELTNSCGSVALSLEGGIDEEPIGLAEEFAATRCGECGEVAQTMTLRRAGSVRLEADPSSAGLLDAFGPRCVERQCVLAPL